MRMRRVRKKGEKKSNNKKCNRQLRDYHQGSKERKRKRRINKKSRVREGMKAEMNRRDNTDREGCMHKT